MLVVVAVAIPASILGTIARTGGGLDDDALWMFGLWGLGILLVALAIGAWWRHSAAQVTLQVILVTGLYASIFGISVIVPDGDLIPHVVAMLAFTVTVVLPLMMRRRALERHPPGAARNRLLGVAAVGLAAGLNFAAQVVYMFLFTVLLR